MSGRPTSKSRGKAKDGLSKPDAIRVQSIFSAGYTFHQAGLLAEAREKYQQVLKWVPKHFDALHLLGVVAFQSRNFVSAVEWLGLAVEVNDDNATTHYFRGLALKELGQLDAAVMELDKAIELKPDYADAHYQCGLVLQDAGRYEAALASLTEFIALQPDSAEAYFHCASVLQELEQLPMALQCFDKAVELKPDFVAAHFGRGLALQNAGNLDAALASYVACVAHQSDHVEAYNNMGNVLRELNQHDASLQSLDRAILLNPGYVVAYYNRGLTLQTVRRYEAALEDYSRCIELMPELVVAHSNRGLVLLELKRYDEAILSFDQAIALDPCDARAYNNRGLVRAELKQNDEAARDFDQAILLNPRHPDAFINLGSLLHKRDSLEAAEEVYRHVLTLQNDHGTASGMAYGCARALCDWRRKTDDEARLERLVVKGGRGVPVFNLFAISNPSCCCAAEFQRCAALAYSSSQFPELLRPPLVEPTRHVPRDKLRIGYLSADFHSHATMYLLRGVFANHDRSRFAIHAYSYGATADDITSAAMEHFDVFRDLKTLSNVDAASLIAADGIDILIDMKGYTKENRLEIAALRPAPVIVSWLGYPGTLGHSRLADYLIGDPVVTPVQYSRYYSETLALLPHCYQPNDRLRVIGENPGRTAEGLPETGFVFCSFNQSYKFDPGTFGLWCDLLNEVPGSVLWLLLPPEPAIANLQREALARGVPPERIVFARAKPLEEHLGRLQLADLALDTYPVTSHTTASDALWAGVPLLTRIGDSFVSRVAASLLITLGLSELVTESRDAYYALAKALALDAGRLTEIRQKLKDRRLTSPLFDTERFTQSLETLFLRIWEQHALGRKEIIVLGDDDVSVSASRSP